MRKKLHNLMLALTAVLTMASCGEFFDPNEATMPASMTISRHDVMLMEGDTCAITALFSPDSISNSAAFWSTDDAAVARFTEGDILQAVAAGTTRVTAVSVADSRLTDTCRVTVIPRWHFTANFDYPADMVVYADVRVHGQPVTDDLLIGAFCGDELRGVGELKEHLGISYLCIRIWARYAMSGERVVFRCFDRGNHRLETFSTTLDFDGETHGTLHELLPLVIE